MARKECPKPRVAETHTTTPDFSQLLSYKAGGTRAPPCLGRVSVPAVRGVDAPSAWRLANLWAAACFAQIFEACARAEMRVDQDFDLGIAEAPPQTRLEAPARGTLGVAGMRGQAERAREASPVLVTAALGPREASLNALREESVPLLTLMEAVW